jgi:hypothetical protein
MISFAAESTRSTKELERLSAKSRFASKGEKPQDTQDTQLVLCVQANLRKKVFAMWVIMLLVLAPALVAKSDVATSDDWSVLPGHDRWYSLKISGVNSGVMRTLAEKNGPGDTRTTEEMRMQIDRGQDHVKLSFRTDFLETLTGKAYRVGYVQNMAQNEITMSYDFDEENGEVAVTSSQTGHNKHSTMPLPTQPYLSRYQAFQYFAKQAKAGDKRIDYSTIKPEMGPQVVNVTSWYEETKQLEVLGVMQDVSVWQTQVTGISLNTTETFLLPDFVLARTLVDSQFGKLEAILSTEKAANDDLAGEDRRAELVYSTYVPLKNVEPKLQAWSGALKAVMRVHSRQGALALPSVGYQHVEAKSAEECTITVDLDHPQEANEGEKDDAAFTTPSAMLDNEDGKIRELAQKALQQGHKQIRALSARVSEADRLVRKHLPVVEGEGAAAGAAAGYTLLINELQALQAREMKHKVADEEEGAASGQRVAEYIPDNVGVGERVELYVKILQKVLEEGESWVSLEMKRVKKVLKKKSKLTEKKVREFIVKRQLLGLFKRAFKGQPLETRSVSEMTARAQAIRYAARNHITRSDLATGFASASEVVRSQTGDCSEYAVLQAAMLKADGIPSRVCSGLVYVQKHEKTRGNPTVDPAHKDEHTIAMEVGNDGEQYELTGNFGWHMWTQGLIDGRWVDLDATLSVPYSVGHVLLGTTSLSDAEGHAGEMELVSLIGNLDVEILSVA